MARGWGRSEEDLAADKEQAGAERDRGEVNRADAILEGKRRSLGLSLARVEEQLARTTNPVRRQALLSARAELVERLEQIENERRAGRGDAGS